MFLQITSMSLTVWPRSDLLTRTNEKVVAIKSSRKRLVVILRRVTVHQLAGIVSLVSGLLQKRCDPLIIETLLYELVVSACSDK